MKTRKDKLFQSVAALALFACTLCPFVEMLLHWDNCIFASGHDTESTLAFVLLLVELSFAIARLVVLLLPAIFQRLGTISSHRIAIRRSSFPSILPTVSPPLSLRI